MQTPLTASFAATTGACPAWLKSTARAALLLGLIKSTAWMVVSWLAFRGFSGL